MPLHKSFPAEPDYNLQGMASGGKTFCRRSSPRLLLRPLRIEDVVVHLREDRVALLSLDQPLCVHRVAAHVRVCQIEGAEVVAQPLLGIDDARPVVEYVGPVRSHREQDLAGRLVQEAPLEALLVGEADGKLLHPLDGLVGMAVDPAGVAVQPGIAVAAHAPGALVDLATLDVADIGEDEPSPARGAGNRCLRTSGGRRARHRSRG